MSAPFEVDMLFPSGGCRIRFNFPNGWSASVMLHTFAERSRSGLLYAGLAAAPLRDWDGPIELHDSEATPDLVAAFLAEVASRGRPA